jgi:hypothetical protein
MPRTLANRVASRFALIAAITIAVASDSLLRTAKFNTISSEVEQSHEVIQCL